MWHHSVCTLQRIFVRNNPDDENTRSPPAANRVNSFEKASVVSCLAGNDPVSKTVRVHQPGLWVGDLLAVL